MACFAILLASLAPAISHAINAAAAAAASRPAAHEHCAETGAAEAQAETPRHAGHAAGMASPEGDHGLHLEHCPFCFTHAGSFGLAPGPATAARPAASAAPRPRLFFHAPAPLFAWASAQPRAPPAFS